jgi:DNA-binding response OmpR family regulator
MKPKRTILCVDEDERSLSIRKVMLETRGYRVVVCSEAGRAIDLMRAGGIDLVLADLMMLKLSSAKLIHQLKDISPSTPAIVFSGALGTCPDDILADVFLSKANCSAAQLLDHIRMALVRKRGPKPAGSSTTTAGRFAS